MRRSSPSRGAASRACWFWSVGASLLSLIFTGEGWASDTLPFLVAAVLVPAAVALVLPLRGVHRCIRAAKHDELMRIHARARAMRC